MPSGELIIGPESVSNFPQRSYRDAWLSVRVSLEEDSKLQTYIAYVNYIKWTDPKAFYLSGGESIVTFELMEKTLGVLATAKVALDEVFNKGFVITSVPLQNDQGESLGELNYSLMLRRT